MKTLLRPFLGVCVALACPSVALADDFGSGANSFSIEFVPIGNPGNSVYSVANPAGSVPYTYRMGKYEVSEQMINKAHAAGALGITIDSRGPDKPATSITWYEAATFVNWLNTSTGHGPAYKFGPGGDLQLWQITDPGYDAKNLFRNRLAMYALPSIHEWYKSAYYDSSSGTWFDYPTGSSNIPDGTDFSGDMIFDAVYNSGTANPSPNDIMDVGLLSPYGTAGQGGNIREWDETAFDRKNTNPIEHRSTLGGSWVDVESLLNAANTQIGILPDFDSPLVGFRVASTIPEPRTSILAVLALAAIGRRRV